jgi:Zn-dependent protease with chaperone function
MKAIHHISLWIDRAISSHWAVGTSAAGVLLIPIVFVMLILPKLADIASRHIPVQLERTLGRYILDSGALMLPVSKLEQSTQAAYRQRVEKLAALAGLEKTETVFRAGLPNAYALPGNIIVLTDGLINVIANEDVIDAVVAHELGHLHQRHLIKKIISINLFAEFALRLNGQDAMAGKIGSSLAILGLAPHYSRAHESEADSYAIDLLIKNKQSPLLFATAMRKLAEFYKARGGSGASYTASHPEAENRAKLAAAQSKN